MMMYGPDSYFVQCDECLRPVPRRSAHLHKCQINDLVKIAHPERFASELEAWLDSAEGRFAQFYAERSRGA